MCVAVASSQATHGSSSVCYGSSQFFGCIQGTLTQSAYLDACGYVVEEILSSVLSDILNLPDIPELESHRLNALCQRLDSLKDLFVLHPGEVNPLLQSACCQVRSLHVDSFNIVLFCTPRSPPLVRMCHRGSSLLTWPNYSCVPSLLFPFYTPI